MTPPLVFAVDPEDPRAPSEEVWNALSAEERRRVVDMLPADVPIDVMAPEGDPHREAKERTLDVLGRFFRRMGRRVYLSSELATYYPDRPRIVPDVLAVLDVDPRPRSKWVVATEGKGLDFVLEVHVEGDKRKDHERNVALYAELGIPEYFIFDRGRLSLRGHRLVSPGARVYQPIVPQGGRYASALLGLDLMLVEGRLRFVVGGTPLLESEEIIGQLETMVDGLVHRREEDERALEEARRQVKEERRRAKQERKRAEEERKRAEEERKQVEEERKQVEEERKQVEEERKRADEAEQRVAALQAELDRLRRGER
ncbi:Uma2 family endonuclease [Polyangium mundeleinium]|uniref:Uma2 family endonuclease n=1 Tax=Polyangium mundeleinium TaxID=2995306 RepID=A0ABT5F4Z0_9BACT|nr:Uma2 family endonuclease [Polyangium mundeleinium]MDC0749149.1 Uma2 family endonuclease [Polyangium mundeleinium]